MSFHDGFDQFERVFTSIPETLAISPMSYSEFTPEVFLCPELFENLNNIEHENGDKLEMKFAEWSPTSSQFVDYHRYALESFPIRSRLHTWIDLVFGYKQRGREAFLALNIFNRLGYDDAELTEEEAEIQKEWTETCGWIPKQLSEQPHPEFVFRQEAVEIEFRLNFAGNENSQFDDMMFKTAIDYRVSTRGAFVAITYPTSLILVFQIVGNEPMKFVKRAEFARSNALFSAVNDRQWITVTVCQTVVVIWSVFTGLVLKIIEKPGVEFLVLDDEMNVFYLGTDNLISQYSLNGALLRTLEIEKRITGLGMLGMDFSFDHRLLVVGCNDGSVTVLSIEFQKCQFIVLQTSKLSAFPLVKFVVHPQSMLIDAYDTTYSC
jgi:hypothetical protein